jgi:hypothetical protein
MQIWCLNGTLPVWLLLVIDLFAVCGLCNSAGNGLQNIASNDGMTSYNYDADDVKGNNRRTIEAMCPPSGDMGVTFCIICPTSITIIVKLVVSTIPSKETYKRNSSRLLVL